jgi:hypothetical protein
MTFITIVITAAWTRREGRNKAGCRRGWDLIWPASAIGARNLGRHTGQHFRSCTRGHSCCNIDRILLYANPGARVPSTSSTSTRTSTGTVTSAPHATVHPPPHLLRQRQDSILLPPPRHPHGPLGDPRVQSDIERQHEASEGGREEFEGGRVC